MGGTSLTAEERQLRWALRVGGALFAGEILLYLLPALIGGTQDDWVQLPFVASSVVKAGFLAGLCARSGRAMTCATSLSASSGPWRRWRRPCSRSREPG